MMNVYVTVCVCVHKKSYEIEYVFEDVRSYGDEDVLKVKKYRYLFEPLFSSIPITICLVHL